VAQSRLSAATGVLARLGSSRLRHVPKRGAGDLPHRFHVIYVVVIGYGNDVKVSAETGGDEAVGVEW
jgi:hypothetical protein